RTRDRHGVDDHLLGRRLVRHVVVPRLVLDQRDREDLAGEEEGLPDCPIAHDAHTGWMHVAHRSPIEWAQGWRPMISSSRSPSSATDQLRWECWPPPHALLSA